MEAPVLAQREKLAGHIIKQLARRKMAGSFAPTGAAAKAQVLEMIPSPATIIRCGTQSVTNLGLWEELAARPGVTLIDPYKPGLSKEEGFELRRKGFYADVMIASSNAITVDGRLVNVDGNGNRVAAMIYGPAKVIVVAGRNKIVEGDIDDAIRRIKDKSAPPNAMRLGKQTPCAVTGFCVDCDSPQRICHITTIIDSKPSLTDLHVLVVNEDMGL